MAEHMAALPKTRASPRAKRKPDMGQEDAPHAGKGARAAKPEALPAKPKPRPNHARSEEHTSELQSLMRISYAVFCLKKKKNKNPTHITQNNSTTQTQTQK